MSDDAKYVLEDQTVYLETALNLINIIMDFVENECPKAATERNDITFAKMACYANRTQMLSSLLLASFEKINTVIKNIEELV